MKKKYPLLMVIVILCFALGCGNSARTKLEQCLEITGTIFPKATTRSGGAYGDAIFEFDKNGKSINVAYSALGYYENEDAKLENLKLIEGGPDNTYIIVGDYIVDGGSSQGARFTFRSFEDEKPNTILIQITGADNGWAHYDNLTYSKEKFLSIKQILSIKGNSSSEIKPSIKNKEIKTSVVSPLKKSNNHSKINKSTRELLQGKWQSIDDKTNFIVLEKNQRKEISEGMDTWDIETFVLSNKCSNESDKDNGTQPENNKYISCKESDMCWYIVNINKNFLTLSFVGRGNTLKYKRVK